MSAMMFDLTEDIDPLTREVWTFHVYPARGGMGALSVTLTGHYREERKSTRARTWRHIEGSGWKSDAQRWEGLGRIGPGEIPAEIRDRLLVELAGRVEFVDGDRTPLTILEAGRDSPQVPVTQCGPAPGRTDPQPRRNRKHPTQGCDMHDNTHNPTTHNVGDLVEIRASICSWPHRLGDHCGCHYLASREGLRTTIVNVHTPDQPDGLTYYQLDGVDVLVYSDEIEAVDEAVQP